MMLEGRTVMPSAFGSGKFGTPCERMQSAYLIACETLLEAEMLGLCEEDPHAVIPTAQVTAVAATRTTRRWPGGRLRARGGLERESAGMVGCGFTGVSWFLGLV